MAFVNESDLAFHIREHLIPGHPGTIKKSTTPVKRKRGRPRKSEVVQLEEEDNVNENEIEDDHSQVPDAEEQTKEESEDDIQIEDEDKDADFVPPTLVINVPAVSAGKRVQPRRSLKGMRTTGFVKDSEFKSIGKKASSHTEDVGSTSDASAVSDTPHILLTSPENLTEAGFSHPEADSFPVTSGTIDTPMKRGRGRPKKRPHESNTSDKDLSKKKLKTIDPTQVIILEEKEGNRFEVVNIEDLVYQSQEENRLDDTMKENQNDEGNSHVEVKSHEEDVKDIMDKILQTITEDGSNTVSDENEPEAQTESNDAELNNIKVIEIFEINNTAEDDEQAESQTDTRKPGNKRGRKSHDCYDEYIKVVSDGAKNRFFVCGLCNKKFTQLRYLKMHLPGHTDKYKCRNCGMKYTRADTYKKHVNICMTKVTVSINTTDGDNQSNLVDPGQSHEVKGTEEEIGNNTIITVESGPEKPEKSEKFPCDICSQEFDNQKYLFRHMAMHTDIFKCRACDKSFSRKDSLQRHVLKCCPQMASEYDIYCCCKCAKTFSTQLGKDNHEGNCTKSFCDECCKVFSDEEKLHLHKCEGVNSADKKQGRSVYSCDECPKSFLNLSYFNQHKAMHEKGNVCGLCDKVLLSEEKKEEHEKICFAVSVIRKLGSVMCEECNEEFSDTKMFREHYRRHSHPHACKFCGKYFVKIGSLHSHVCNASAAGVFQCSECEKDFGSELLMWRHKTEIHGEPKLSCEICHKKFYRKDKLDTHICKDQLTGEDLDIPRNKELRAKSSKLMCHICGKYFASVSNLNNHMKVHGEKNYVCEICDKRFHYMQYLRIHMSGFHEKRFSYQCTECGKVLTSKPGLTNHMRLFHAEHKTVFPCPECGKEFAQKGNMKIHLFSHTSERNFICQYCHKAFKYPDQLNKHRLIHTMQNKLQCDQCDKVFVKSYELKKHQACVHSGMMYVCEFCGARCGHKHTAIRHYKRKHPAQSHLVEDPEYVTGLYKMMMDDKFRKVYNGKKGVILANEAKNTGTFVQTGFMQENIQVVNTDTVEEMIQGGDGLQTLDQSDMDAAVTVDGTTLMTQDGTFTIPSEGGSYSLQSVQHVIEGKDGEKKTVVILQLINNADTGLFDE